MKRSSARFKPNGNVKLQRARPSGKGMQHALLVSIGLLGGEGCLRGFYGGRGASCELLRDNLERALLHLKPSRRTATSALAAPWTWRTGCIQGDRRAPSRRRGDGQNGQWTMTG